MIVKSHVPSNNLVILGLIIAVSLALSPTIALPHILTTANVTNIANIANITDTTNSNTLPIQIAWGAGIPDGPATLTSPPSSSSNIKLDVTSQQQVHAVAGQFITLKGTITNLSPTEAVMGGIAYISLVDLKDKIPVDLEDWSAQKGLYIPSIAPSQSLPLEWKVRLVKAGSYTIGMLFNKDGDFSSPPAASSKIFLEVAPKINLNPGNVLPVAFGVPAVLMASLGAVNYIRGRKMGIYK
jgi:hypothetical protein